MGKWRRLALITAGLVVLDQFSKLLVVRYLAPVGSMDVIPGLFSLTFVLNTGVAFGLMAGAKSALQSLLLISLSLAALAVVLALYHQAGEDERLLAAGLGLIAAGAVANMADRLRLGGVIDFLHFYLGPYHWPVFNLADSFITLGTALVVLTFVFRR